VVSGSGGLNAAEAGVAGAVEGVGAIGLGEDDLEVTVALDPGRGHQARGNIASAGTGIGVRKAGARLWSGNATGRS
jgi:hypothetical protein